MKFSRKLGDADVSIMRYADHIFGDLIALAPIGRYRTNLVWLCFCTRCGSTTLAHQSRLLSGTVRTCGCAQRTQNGLTAKYRYTYQSYKAMLLRCYNPDHTAYKWYGQRGITVCDRWRESFVAFLDDLGPRPEGCTLDRRDPNGNYEPENCTWSTPSQQRANQRSRVVQHG